MCEAVCVRRGGEGRQEGEQMGSFSSAVCTLPLSFSPHFHGCSILPFLCVFVDLSPCSSAHPLPTLSHSVVLRQMAAGQRRQQQPQSRSQSVSRGWGEEKGWWKEEEEVGVRHMESLVKGPPQRECACACSGVMNRGGRGDRIQWKPIKTEI